MAKDKSKATKASRIARIAAEQEVHPIRLSHEPTSEYRRFEQTISILYGPTGIGKTTFGISIPGAHILATEPINSPKKFSSTRIENWPTFKHFLDELDKNPGFADGVSMWVLDTIDALVPKCMSTICYEWGLTELSDEGFARAWSELKQELLFSLCRLATFGPGILMVSHERMLPFMRHRIQLEKESLDLSPSISNAVSFLSSIILHMRYVDKSKSSAELGDMRCLCIRGSDDEVAKDNTELLQAVCTPDTNLIKFKTEEVAIRKILGCFDAEPDVKKSKLVKKKVKKKKAKGR